MVSMIVDVLAIKLAKAGDGVENGRDWWEGVG